jgi:hypothetical protein
LSITIPITFIYKDIKHTISGAKSSLVKKLRSKLPASETGMLLSDLSGRERRWLKGFIESGAKRMGFRTYTRQPSICAQVNRMMEESEDLERAKCDENGTEYIPIDPFSQRERFKLELWNRLSESEKESWREVAQKTEGSDKMTE